MIFKNICIKTYPDLDRRSKSSTQPVSIWREAQGSDDVVVVQCVQVLAIIQVPQHRLHVLATRCTERSVRGDCHSIQITRMSQVVDLQLAVSEVPYLENNGLFEKNNVHNLSFRCEFKWPRCTLFSLRGSCC